jgi:hypothetical protein
VATPLYNDNNDCIKWWHNLTTTGNRHIEHRENVTREWVEDGCISNEQSYGGCYGFSPPFEPAKMKHFFQRGDLIHGLFTPIVITLPIVGIFGQSNTLSDPPFHKEHNNTIIVGMEYRYCTFDLNWQPLNWGSLYLRFHWDNDLIF